MKLRKHVGHATIVTDAMRHTTVVYGRAGRIAKFPDREAALDFIRAGGLGNEWFLVDETEED